MCGIAGILAGNGRAVDEPALRAMTAALAARGPDGEGFFVENPMGLGHRRLAIIDVAGGQQPLFAADGNVAAVVNGEIYNFVNLRDQLTRLGHRFRTRSDSEVVAHGFAEWGPAVVDRLEGMFAFAAWDRRTQTLCLARDRMGEKPLYWAELPGGGLAFASELKALRHAPGLSLEIDPASLARYLVYEVVPAPRSIFHGVHKLAPGTLLAAEPGRAPRLSSYWDLPFPGEEEPREADPARAAEGLLAELRRAVRERLVSDVPLGVFLSGGIDSSSVAVLASEVRGSELDTFSIGFEDPSFDESAAALRVARAIGSRHHQERLSPAVLLDLLPDIGRLLDEPLGDGSIVPTHLLSRFARGTVTVALGGDGGDELFAGYPTFQAEKLARFFFDGAPGVLGRAGAAVGGAVARALPVGHGYMSFDFKVKRFLRGAEMRGARRHQAWIGALLPEEARGVLRADRVGLVEEDLYRDIDERLARCPSENPWDRLQYYYAKGFLGDQVLMKVDRASMAVGLEVRAPLLDREVIRLACRLAPRLKLRGLQTKAVFKRAMRGLLPDEILDRKKQGFAMPVGKWLKGPLRPLLEEDLGEARLRADGFFAPPAVRRLVDEHLAGQADHRKALWTLVAFQRWWQAWREG